MSALNQKTIKKIISFDGVGLHSGIEAKINIKPAEPNTGIVFKRIDLNNNNIVIPNIFNVSSVVLCTTISNEHGVSVSTIEHLMGALYGMGIDNALIEINNQEVPILDGSAKLFVEEIIKVHSMVERPSELSSKKEESKKVKKTIKSSKNKKKIRKK